MKKLFIVLLAFALPLATFAQIPAFPMAFYGTVTIDNTAAPAGSVIRAYAGDELLGTIVVQNVGTYGTNDPIGDRLLVSEFTGELTFTIEAATANGGVETGGTSPVTHGGFVAGETLEKNLAFSIAKSSGNTSGGGSRSSGGGGGSSSRSSNPANDAPVAQVFGASTSTDATIALKLQVIELLGQLIKLLQLKLQLMHGAS